MAITDRITPSIFISYSHKDKEKIEPVISYLVRAGWNVWQDERKLLPGHQIMSQLSSAISDVDFYLVFFSKSSVNSPYVLYELQNAMTLQVEKNRPSSPCKAERSRIARYFKGIFIY